MGQSFLLSLSSLKKKVWVICSLNVAIAHYNLKHITNNYKSNLIHSSNYNWWIRRNNSYFNIINKIGNNGLIWICDHINKYMYKSYIMDTQEKSKNWQKPLFQRKWKKYFTTVNQYLRYASSFRLDLCTLCACVYSQQTVPGSYITGAWR